MLAKIIVDRVRAFDLHASCRKLPKITGFPPPPSPYPMLNTNIGMQMVIDLLSKDILSLTTLKRGSGGRC